MRAISVMRLVIFGAVGFGIGWAVAGFFNTAFIAITAPMYPPHSPPPTLVDELPQLSWFFAGACGGAALGLAIGGRKNVVALSLAGSLSFGAGLYLFFFLAFLFGLPSIGAAMGTGVVAGSALGFALDPDTPSLRKMAVMALAGLVGFGTGGAIASALGRPFLSFDWEHPPLWLVQYVLVQGIVGIIGGASLGAALGYLQKRKLTEERRPRVR
jgi:MFS family permease